jgi:hypothetical protein
MPERYVDSTIERSSSRAANSNQPERIDKSLALAAVLQAIPVFIWAAPLVLIFGFILMALWYNREGHALHDFTSGVLLWGSRLLIFAGGCLVLAAGWKCYRMYRQFMIDAQTERTARATARKAVAGARNAELKNELLEADILLRKQIPNVILALTRTGVAFEYDAKGNLKVAGPAAQTLITQIGQEQLGAGGQAAIAGPAGLPEKVLYEDVRAQVPKGHVLVGVGLRGLIETVERAVGALVWIVGLSGTGKTSTTVLRVEERAAAGHSFLGVDPHFFKPDSLTNAVKAYASRFIRPMARTPEETNEVLNLFLNEFYGRKNGSIPKPWKPVTLIVDEVGALVDAIDEIEKENVELLKRIARICGQESRNFEMGGIMISQQATGLAWLRKVALMVIVHQLLMNSEKELACNGDKTVMKDMEHWPIGRTYVFGVGFGAGGARTVQQPYFGGPSGPVVAADGDELAADDLAGADLEDESNNDLAAAGPGQEENAPAPRPALSGDLLKVYDAVQYMLEVGGGFNAREVGQVTGFGKDKANGLINQLVGLGYITRRKAG